MSLYEQFHSDINKKFMFDILKNELLQTIQSDISTDKSNYEHFLTYFPKVFNENNVDEIEALNKALLDSSISYFSDKVKKKEVVSDFEKLLYERNQIFNEDNSNDDSIVDTPSPQVLPKNEKKILPYTEINELDEVPEKKEETKKKDKILPLSLLSSKRTNINSSRYNYRISLDKLSIDAKKIKKVSKLLLPIEGNFIFDIPVISLSIPELDCKIHMQQDQVIESKNKQCSIYIPIGEHTIDIEKVDKITIDIRDITETKYPINDILKINIIEIKENTIDFTCSNIHRMNFKINDNIKIINIQSGGKLEVILDTPFKIKKINRNVITCKLYEEYEKEIYNDIDMKIMNMSNQNILYFN